MSIQVNDSSGVGSLYSTWCISFTILRWKLALGVERLE